ncbi:hypothetical protein C8J57DRAFT_1533809 [Mycena rebaudengoi]|nr:hypothetical protein C8J57DRAFT_1533809 [Mycena rebaudengoi]
MPKGQKPYPKFEVMCSCSYWADLCKLRQQCLASGPCKGTAYVEPQVLDQGHVYTFMPGRACPIVTVQASGKVVSAPDFTKPPDIAYPSRPWAAVPKPPPGPSAADIRLAKSDAEWLAKLTHNREKGMDHKKAGNSSRGSGSGHVSSSTSKVVQEREKCKGAARN